MKIEILEDVLEELANKLDVYGSCNSSENKEDCKCTVRFCCRTGFMSHYDDRIRTAILNEEKLEQSNLK
jgi:hypothetical protein